ncbi:2-succinylbenzoate-CoA ligase [Halobacteriales archaeon SW_5_68_122]|nr:MAG: 2-succinylbenzoate-CoA ligase [Halobacteriales archaeon SW_5_68_122]
MRDWLAIRAEATPEATALAAAGDTGTASSYADLDRRVEVLAGRLAARGVGVDDAVAVASPTRGEFVELVHAAQRLGATLVPLDPRLTAAEFETRLERVRPRATVCSGDSEAAVVAAADTPVLALDDPSAGAERLGDVDPEPFDLPEWTADEPLVVMFTSGTTGDPKGVVLTLANVLASATASAFRLGLLRAADATCLSVVPTMLERLLAAGRMPDLRFVLVGGAPCSPGLVERAHDRDVPVAPTYGMTETASQIATARPGDAAEHPESVGHPLIFAELSVVDEAGAPCDPGETGELVVSGAVVTPGYLDDAATAEAFSNGGLRTGDRGYRDEAGRLHVEGRIDDTVVTGGENVDPTEVADALRSHVAVADCAVVGLPDEEWGQRVAALAALDGEATADDLRAHCRGRLADYKRPRTVEFAAELPRTASGTVDREAVRRLLEGTDTEGGSNLTDADP